MTTQTPDPIPERMSRLEGAYEQVSERLSGLTTAVESSRIEQNEKIEGFRAELNSFRNTMIAVGAGAWGTTMIAILGLYLRT